MEKVRFSLKGLQEVMAGGQVTTSMQTQLEGVSVLSGVCTVELRFDHGNVVACLFSNGHSGLYGFDAFRFLATLVGEQELQWSTQTTKLLRETGPLQGKQPQGVVSTSVPVRLRPPTESEFASWSRLQRQVYNLVDGVKDIQRLAGVLSQKTDVVATQLATLATSRVVAFQAAPNTEESIEQKFASLFHS